MRKEAKNYLEGKYQELSSKESTAISLTLEWVKSFPKSRGEKDAGVYLILLDGDVVYVGETSSIRSRMNDLRNTKNHTVRRNLGNEMFQNHPKFYRATSKKSFVPEIESQLEEFMEKHLEVKFIHLALGRKELEEYIIDTLDTPKYNIKTTKRLNK